MAGALNRGVYSNTCAITPKWEWLARNVAARLPESAPDGAVAGDTAVTTKFSRQFAKFALVLVSAAFAPMVVGEVAVVEPEYVGDIVAVVEGSAVPLEKQRASNRARAGAIRARAANEVQGSRSPVRLSGQTLQFVVRHDTNSVNPQQIISVFQLNTNDRRDVRLIETGSVGAFTARSMDIDYLPFTSERYGESSYLMTLQGPLEPGEYAITIEGSRDVFNMFGTD